MSVLVQWVPPSTFPAIHEEEVNYHLWRIERTQSLANVRIHIEHVTGAVRQKFCIMSATGFLPKELFQQKGEGDIIILDAIVTVCCGLNNLCEGIVPFE